jgi:hypothetical protein
MMTFEQRLDLALAYAKRQGIEVKPERRAQIEQKIREKMAKQGAVPRQNRADLFNNIEVTDDKGGVEPYTYGDLHLSRIEERAPVRGGDLQIKISNNSVACIVQVSDGSRWHTFTLPPYSS